MGMLGNGWKGNIVSGLAIGAGAAILAPIVIPALAKIVKPVAKSAIKGGLILYERGQEIMADVKEVAEDLLVEVKEEIKMEKVQKEAVSAQECSAAGEMPTIIPEPTQG